MLSETSFDDLEGKRVLITGGTGSLGKKLTRLLLDHCSTTTIVIFSRDEFKQFLIQREMKPEELSRLRFFLGDVREESRLRRALEGVDYVIHAAALKHVPAAEYNPFEVIKTNVIGAENVINACLDLGVQRVVALSTDKAANPINLYGATKLCSDKLFVSGNNYSGPHATRFAVVRYGNVVGSRGSVIPLFLQMRDQKELPITDMRMTRFWITLDQGAYLVLNSLRTMIGGEIFVPKIPSMRITDLAKTIHPQAKLKEIGIRPGEKLHEVMIPVDDGRQTYEFDSHFTICPSFPWWEKGEGASSVGGTPCPPDFYYSSDQNNEWVTEAQMIDMIRNLPLPEAQAWLQERGKALSA